MDETIKQTYDARKQLEHTCHTAFFVAVVMAGCDEMVKTPLLPSTMRSSRIAWLS